MESVWLRLDPPKGPAHFPCGKWAGFVARFEVLGYFMPKLKVTPVDISKLLPEIPKLAGLQKVQTSLTYAEL